MKWFLVIIHFFLIGSSNIVLNADPEVLSLFLQPPPPPPPQLISSSSSVHQNFHPEIIIPPTPQSINVPSINHQKNDKKIVDMIFDRITQESNYGPPNGIPYYSHHHPPTTQQQPIYRPPSSLPKLQPVYQPVVKPQQYPSYNQQNPYHHQQQQQKKTKIIKYVSVFVAPQQHEYYKPQKISIEGGETEKHVNIIFIKNPAEAKGSEVEVDLPPNPEQKTLVYVLNEKFNPKVKLNPSTNNNPSQQKQPNVFFIQYKKNEQEDNPDHHHHPHHHPNHQQEYGINEYKNNNNQENSFNYYSASSSSKSTLANDDGGSLNDKNTSYAPTMDHETYNILSKREIIDKNLSSSNKGSDFRPYKYASNMDHRYYGVYSF